MRSAIAATASAALLLGCQAFPWQSDPAKQHGNAAEVAGEVITVDELDEFIKEELFAKRTKRRNPWRLYEVRRPALDRLIEARALERAAAQRGIAPSELMEQELAARGEVTDEEIRAFFEKNQERIGDSPYEEIEPAIRMVLIEERRREVIAELRGKTDVNVFLKPPRVEVAAEGPSLGPADAPVTIVEFSDFQCPYCRRATPLVRQIAETYPETVRIVYRHLPLDSLHPRARAAAEASACAEEQGRFWEYHDLVFENTRELEDENLLEFARQLELDTERFQACVESQQYADKVQRDADAASAVGITGTPAFVVNGIVLTGVQPMSRFTEIIEAELGRKEEAEAGLTGEDEVGTL